MCCLRQTSGIVKAKFACFVPEICSAQVHIAPIKCLKQRCSIHAGIISSRTRQLACVARKSHIFAHDKGNADHPHCPGDDHGQSSRPPKLLLRMRSSDMLGLCRNSSRAATSAAVLCVLCRPCCPCVAVLVDDVAPAELRIMCSSRRCSCRSGSPAPLTIDQVPELRARCAVHDRACTQAMVRTP